VGTVVEQFANRVQDYASGIADRLGGQPMSGQQLSKDEAIQRWNFSPLGTTQAADAAYQQLVARGTPPGQALDQVYPMRSMLYAGGQDLQASIDTATKIASWAAEASGQQPPEIPKQSTLPGYLAQQHLAQMQMQPPPPPMAAPSLPVPPASQPSAVGPALPPPPAPPLS
jgi:hypothetical protein